MKSLLENEINTEKNGTRKYREIDSSWLFQTLDPAVLEAGTPQRMSARKANKFIFPAKPMWKQNVEYFFLEKEKCTIRKVLLLGMESFLFTY